MTTRSPPAEGSAGTGVLSGLRTATQLTWVAHSNRMIAVSRLICATVLLIVATTDPRDPGFQFEFDDILALSFVILSLIALAIALRDWFVDFTVSGTLILLDVVIFLLLVIPTGIAESGMVVAPLCLMAHIVIGSVLRWRSASALAIAAFLNTAWVADIAVAELPRGTVDPGIALRWIIFAMLGSSIALWVARQMPLAALPRLRTDIPPQGLQLTTSAFSYALETSHASGAALCWIDRDELGCFARGMGTLAGVLPPTKLGFIAAAAFTELQPMLFDLPRNRAIVAVNGKLAVSRTPMVPGHELLKELGVQGGLCVPVDSIEGRSWLMLTGVPMVGWGHLQLAAAISAEIAHATNWRIASENARDAALYRLRQTVARDLHDSVAHSLAGTRFLLVALRSRVAASPEVAEEIDSIRTALDAEHLHVRRLIAQLRDTDAEMRRRDLIEDLEAILPILASRWQIEVELVDSDIRLLVPGWFSLEIQQIVREAISNGVRHGKANIARVKCVGLLGLVTLEVTDNGAGFPNPELPTPPRSISERVAELGGSLEIESCAGLTILRMSISSGSMH